MEKNVQIMCAEALVAFKFLSGGRVSIPFEHATDACFEGSLDSISTKLYRFVVTNLENTEDESLGWCIMALFL